MISKADIQPPNKQEYDEARQRYDEAQRQMKEAEQILTRYRDVFYYDATLKDFENSFIGQMLIHKFNTMSKRIDELQAEVARINSSGDVQ